MFYKGHIYVDQISIILLAYNTATHCGNEPSGDAHRSGSCDRESDEPGPGHVRGPGHLQSLLRLQCLFTQEECS